MSVFAHLDYFAGLMVFIAVIMLLVFKRMPTAEGFEHFLASLNTKGGNIAVLAGFTYISLQATLRWMYHVDAMIHSQQLTDANSFRVQGFQFLTTTAFGLFAGALISTLTGLKTDTRRTDTQTVTVETKAADVPPGGSDAPKAP